MSTQIKNSDFGLYRYFKVATNPAERFENYLVELCTCLM
jgi:hypothetical protein